MLREAHDVIYNIYIYKKRFRGWNRTEVPFSEESGAALPMFKAAPAHRGHHIRDWTEYLRD